MTIETMLYAETHFACAIILLIIALNVSFSGIDSSLSRLVHAGGVFAQRRVVDPVHRGL